MSEALATCRRSSTIPTNAAAPSNSANTGSRSKGIGGQVYGRDSHFKLWNGSQSFELLGAIWLRAANELVMIFEDGFVAIVQSDRSFEVSRIFFEVAWIKLPDNSSVVVRDAA